MRQRYVIIKNEKTSELLIREFAELDKGLFSLLYEESYDENKILAATQEGKESLISAILTNSFYPPRIYAEPIADEIAKMYQPDGKPTSELLFDDIDLFQKEADILPDIKEAGAEKLADKMDELLEDKPETDLQEIISDVKSDVKSDVEPDVKPDISAS